MLLAVARPTAIAGCVLNDIGPVIDLKGLVRIKSYVGKLPQPANFQQAADILRGSFGSQFPKLNDDDWAAFARRTFKEAGGRIVPDYDVKLATTLEATDLERPLPELWKEFDALVRMPGHGDPRRQFGHSVGRHRRSHAGAPHQSRRSSRCRTRGMRRC